MSNMNTNGIVAQTEAALRRGGLPLSQLSGEPGSLSVSRGFSVTTHRGEICVTYREGYDAGEPELFCEETTLARLASACRALEARGFRVSWLDTGLVLIVHGKKEVQS